MVGVKNSRHNEQQLGFRFRRQPATDYLPQLALVGEHTVRSFFQPLIRFSISTTLLTSLMLLARRLASNLPSGQDRAPLRPTAPDGNSSSGRARIVQRRPEHAGAPGSPPASAARI
jgi:hypothetical protein